MIATKKTVLFTLVLIFQVYCTLGQSKPFNQTLTDSLKSWSAVDQIAARSPEGKYKQMPQAAFEQFKDSVFTDHYRLLTKVFDQYGFPGYDQVGKEGSNHFWLMVQHCDRWPDFQFKVLAAMNKEVKRHNADPNNYAYLTDRVRVNTGQKQLYGTQLQYKKTQCQAIPRPMSDSLNVNQRRKALGMELIELYLNRMTQLNFQMNKAQYEAAGITGPTLLPVPRTDH